MPIAKASGFSPHQPVEMVHVPNPTSLTRTSVPGKSLYFMISALVEQFRRGACEISDYDIGASAPDTEQRIHHHALAFDPAAIGGCLNHSVLPTHLVRGDGK